MIYPCLGVILDVILRKILHDFYENPWRRVNHKGRLTQTVAAMTKTKILVTFLIGYW